MSDYVKSTNFATKDSLLTGDPLKVIKGTEIDDEFEALETSIATKADLASPTFTGVPKAPTAASGTNTTQLATTAFVTSEIDTAVNNLPADSVCSAQIAANCVTADELDVAGDGTSGQVLQSDGDGSFSWYSLPGAASNPLLSPAASNPTQRDDSSALQEGDIYYNTAEDELRTYDGSTWNSAVPSIDLAAGATGTTSTPPVGAIVYLRLNTNYSGGFSGAYGSTAAFTPTTGSFLNAYFDYNLISQGWQSSGLITSGTWRFLGGNEGYNYTTATVLNYALAQRIA
jgi:hypothetical protein